MKEERKKKNIGYRVASNERRQKIEGKTSSKTWEIIEAKHGKWKNC